MIPAAITLSAYDAAPVAAPHPVAESSHPPADRGLVPVSESYATTLNAIIGSIGATGNAALTGRYGGYWPADRVASPTHAPQGFYAEQQLWVAISWSRWLCERNILAQGLLNRVVSYLGTMAVQFVRDGLAPGAMPAGLADRDGDGEPDADPLVQRAQALWERWCKASDWGRGTEDREKECRVRLMRDGNVILRFGCGRDGMPWVRFVEPEQLRTPTGRVPELDGYAPQDLDWRQGVCTLRRDAETVLGYWIADPDGGGEFVEARYIVRMKANVDRTIKMGLPDFFPAEDHLQQALGIIANSGATAREQASVAWIQEYANATADAVRTLVAQGAEAYAGRAGAGVPPAVAPAVGGNPNFQVKLYGNTRVVHADANRQFKAGPVSEGVPSFMQVVEATLRAVGKLFGLEDWFGGDSSFASALVENGPFVQAIKDRQKQMQGFVEKVAAVVLALFEECGRLPGGATEALEPVVTAPPVIAADEEKQVRTWISELGNKLVDPQEVIKKRGRDPKVVAANIAAWEKHFAPEPPPPPPGPASPPAPPAPKDPTPHPPGSAGGDGFSPNRTPIFESAGPHTYGCVLVPLTGEASNRLLELGRQVRDADLVGDGRETEPHVTVRYGIHTDDPAEVGPILRASGPLVLELGAVSVFAGPEYDVLKVDVEGAALRRLHDALGSLPHTDTHATYRPHATIAYVRSGLGAGYARRLAALGFAVEASKVVFSPATGGRAAVPLGTRVFEDGGYTTKKITVHRDDGTTYEQTRRVRAGEPDADGTGAPGAAAGASHELSERDRADLTAGVELDVEALPADRQPPPELLARAKDLALTAAVKVYEWSIRLTPAAQKIGEVIGDLFDTPADMGKLGYNPSMSSDTANVSVGDPVKANLTDALGFGVSGHLVASIASKVIVKAGVWAASKLKGAAAESDADGVAEWADMISQLFTHLNAQLGMADGAPDAATVERELRALLATRTAR